jgi:16S rRNA (cytosine967-C5)-methyltransferase
VRLIAQWLDTAVRVDALLESLPRGMDGVQRSRVQNLVFGVIRHFGRIGSALDRLVAHPPRFATRAALFVAGWELIESAADGGETGQTAKIVHHAVEKTKGLASPAEARLVNAVVRKMAAVFAAQVPPGPIAPAEVLAEYFSHPVWLVRRWLATFGAPATRSLLEWNQSPAPSYGRWRDGRRPLPDWLEPTEWPGFVAVPSRRWPDAEALLHAGALYIQDPGTRLAVDLLAPGSGEAVLDLCAAPGGKSLMIADVLAGGSLVALDLPSARMDRLRENLARTKGVPTTLVAADLLSGAAAALAGKGLPTAYSAVLLDVPCSNTGVMRHRVDVRWRLREDDFARHPRQQEALLRAAAGLVSPGGRLVYSTCSIDPSENGPVVDSFLDRHRDFRLERSMVAVPWIERHDGAGAFLLRKGPSQDSPMP